MEEVSDAVGAMGKAKDVASELEEVDGEAVPYLVMESLLSLIRCSIRKEELLRTLNVSLNELKMKGKYDVLYRTLRKLNLLI